MISFLYGLRSYLNNVVNLALCPLPKQLLSHFGV